MFGLVTTKGDIKKHVLRAYSLGKNLDLTECQYGPMTGRTYRGFRDKSMSYYHLLAGHCMLTDTRTVLEVGTHYGGSSLAMLTGMRTGNGTDPIIGTMDVSDLNRERLDREPEIRKVIGDSRIRGCMAELKHVLEYRPVDLLYIDALKDASFVLHTIFNADSLSISPTWLFLDDVQTNESMRRMWSLFEELEPQMVYLISKDYPEIRDPFYGYGLIYVAGTQNLMGRAEEMMERLGLDTGELWSSDNENRVNGAFSAGKGASYAKRTGDDDASGSRFSLSVCYDLACDTYQGRGDIVQFGDIAGEMTRAISRGLQDNSTIRDKVSRITTIADFRFNIKSQENVIKGQVNFGESTKPILLEALKPFPHFCNIVDILPNTARWCGRPIELMVLQGIRSTQINANIFAEFVPRMVVDESLIYNTELVKHFRPWVTYTYAYLREHFEIISYKDGEAILKYIKPISDKDINLIIENRFDFDLCISAIQAYRKKVDSLELKWDLTTQECFLNIKAKDFDRAFDLACNLEKDPIMAKSVRRTNIIKKIKTDIAR